MSGGFTPGPWGVSAVTHTEVIGPSQRTICRAHRDAPTRSEDETHANARLIAAAPCLYAQGEAAVAALQAMMDTWLDYHDANSLTQPVSGRSDAAFDKALAARDGLAAALAKARGEA